MSASLILDSTFAAPLWRNGWVRLRLVNASPRAYSGFRLGVTSIHQLSPRPDSPATLIRRIGSYHELAAPEGFVLEAGGVWDIGPLDLEMQLVHANDGPFRAFLIEADGSTVAVQVAPVERMPTVRVGNEAPPPLYLDSPDDVTSEAWDRAAGCEGRLYPDDANALGTTGTPVAAAVDSTLGAEDFSISPGPGTRTITAGSPIALQWALMELARRQRGDGGLDGSEFTPRHGVRGFMIDVSRHFYPATDIDELIDIAAWRRLNALHLHLTDDDAWRLPISAYPALTEVGAWRGHGLAIPPLQGSGADAYGGSYTHEQIRGWIAKASGFGIEIIPEIDTPAHCFAAIVSVPGLRDPDDTRTAESIHHFPHNTLNPGLPATREFLETVFGEVADLFPGPRIHMGCDEVPDGVWDKSPAAQRYAAERGIAGSAAIAAAFMADIVDIVKSATGRDVGVWQEAAEAGSLRPGDGWVGGWKSGADCRKLAAAGYEVVALAAEAYYLDMAGGPEWHRPGMFWAGTIDVETIRDYDLTAGWSDAERANLAGIMATLFTEHVPDRVTLRTQVIPRLDVIADSCWDAVG